MIQVEILADSITHRGHRLTTFKCRYWRAILAEINTHRQFSRNSPSSRAIPVARMIESIINDPAMPVSWPKNQSGMQAIANLDPEIAAKCEIEWIDGLNDSLKHTRRLTELGLHKQVANRLLEPWMHTTSLISATDWQNFFHLRVHKDAQPDFQALAHRMLRSYLASKPQVLEYGEWHLPFGDKIPDTCTDDEARMIVTGRAARISYETHDGVMDVKKDLEITDKLLGHGHWSPAEHAAEAIDSDEYFGNFQGWKQYRKFFDNENRKGDLHELLASYETSIGVAKNCAGCGERIATVGNLCASCAAYKRNHV